MISVIKIILVFVLLIILMRKKWPLGLAMLAGSLVLGLVFKMPFTSIVRTMIEGIIEKTTLELGGVLILILILSKILQETGQLRRTVEKLKIIVKDSRLILAGAPAMIGLLPMPGGAIFSAPMVELAEETAHKLDPLKRTFINHWFRHIWEYIFPLYPGLILAAKMAEVELQQMALVQLPLTIIAVIVGIIFGLLPVPLTEKKDLDNKQSQTKIKTKVFWSNLRGLIIDTLPISLVIILTLGFKVPILYSLGVSIVMALIMNKIKPGSFCRLIDKKACLNAFILIAGIMVFRRMIEASGSMEEITDSFITYQVPVLVLIMGLPFLIGLVTGITVAFVGICYPVLFSFIALETTTTTGMLNYLMLAFTCGFAGVMISPVHVCLILTKDYFKADAAKVYLKLLLPVIILILGGLSLFLINNRIY